MVVQNFIDRFYTIACLFITNSLSRPEQLPDAMDSMDQVFYNSSSIDSMGVVDKKVSWKVLMADHKTMEVGIV